MLIHLQNPFNYFDKIFFINLDSRPDRLYETLEEFKKVGITNAERISGVTNSAPTHGCHLSHAKVFIEAMETGCDNILIFEDDVEFFPNAKDNLRNALNELPDDWDMFYLGANLDRYEAHEISPHIAKLTGAFATHAYAVRKDLFPLLFHINSSEETAHNDVAYSELVHPLYNCYLALPLIAGQRTSYSDIQKTTMSSNEVFLTRLNTNLVRKK